MGEIINDMSKNNTIITKDSDQNIKLNDDFELLDIMTADSKRQPPLYSPGPYWANKIQKSTDEIKKTGIDNFRGSSLIGLSYGDNLYTDNRQTSGHALKRIVQWLTKTYPISKLYDNQVRWTEAYASESNVHAQEILNLKDRTRYLLEKYNMPYSLLGNCLKKVEINGCDYSIYYLNVLEQHDNIASHINFNNVNSVFEIGGGFGARTHLLLENYKNIRKILYLDIPPNLYTGTQYLKTLYGSSAVHDYRDTKDLESIKFSNDDSLEIFCIAPWQIENFKDKVNVFLNSSSFVEMPKKIIQNYVDKFNKFPDSKNSAVALNTYDNFELNSTLHPNELPLFFKERKFENFEVEKLLESSRKNYYYVSPGSFSLQIKSQKNQNIHGK